MSASPDPCGGRWVTGVPTAISRDVAPYATSGILDELCGFTRVGHKQDMDTAHLRNSLITKHLQLWRRGESNPRPKSPTTRSLHA